MKVSGRHFILRILQTVDWYFGLKIVGTAHWNIDVERRTFIEIKLHQKYLAKKIAAFLYFQRSFSRKTPQTWAFQLFC
jgi:hypothetical protein